MGNTKRIHSLDALRGIMMLLGILLHSSIYCKFNFLCDYIHSFRMPIFFIIAGFFGALLFYERSPLNMLTNRFKRLVLPFIVFVFLIWLILSKGLMSYFATLLNISLTEVPTVFSWSILFPNNTFHLWFLYYLIIISLLVSLCTLGFQYCTILTRSVSQIFAFIIISPTRKVLVLTLLIFTTLLLIGEVWVKAQTGWIPNWRGLLFYLLFYLLGWGLFQAEDYLNTFKKYCLSFTLLGFAIAIIGYFIFDTYTFPVEFNMFCNALSCCFSLFGIIGLFLKYFSQGSFLMRYISDASYWIYLIHLPMTMYFPVILESLSVPSLPKFILVNLATLVISFLSYHYFVRSTFIGMFLNGRIYPRSTQKKVYFDLPTKLKN